MTEFTQFMSFQKKLLLILTKHSNIAFLISTIYSQQDAAKKQKKYIQRKRCCQL